MSRYIRAPENIKNGSFKNINNPQNDLLREPRYHNGGYRERIEQKRTKIFAVPKQHQGTRLPLALLQWQR